jgi:hypothetical protein
MRIGELLLRRAPFASGARRGLPVLMLAVCLAGSAQAAGSLGSPSSPAEQCLAPATADRVKPVYPAEMLEIKRDAVVRAAFTFTGPDSAPAVDIDDKTGRDFSDAVRRYARQLRVPCMHAGDPPVTLRQVFDFVPNDGRKVALSLPVDVDRMRRESVAPCGVQLTGKEIPFPEYPTRELRDRLEGNVVVRLHFFDAAAAPELTVLDDGGSHHFVDAVRPSVAALRMTCLGKEPIDLQVFYRFMVDGSADRLVMRDLSLAQFIRAAKPVPAGSVYFDTTLMKCPFDVRLTFRQPWNPNRIDELDEDVESRRAFLEWLSTLEFRMPPRDANKVLGQSLVVRVPCARIDL